MYLTGVMCVVGLTSQVCILQGVMCVVGDVTMVSLYAASDSMFDQTQPRPVNLRTKTSVGIQLA